MEGDGLHTIVASSCVVHVQHCFRTSLLLLVVGKAFGIPFSNIPPEGIDIQIFGFLSPSKNNPHLTSIQSWRQRDKCCGITVSAVVDVTVDSELFPSVDVARSIQPDVVNSIPLDRGAQIVGVLWSESISNCVLIPSFFDYDGSSNILDISVCKNIPHSDVHVDVGTERFFLLNHSTILEEVVAEVFCTLSWAFSAECVDRDKAVAVTNQFKATNQPVLGASNTVIRETRHVFNPGAKLVSDGHSSSRAVDGRFRDRVVINKDHVGVSSRLGCGLRYSYDLFSDATTIYIMVEAVPVTSIRVSKGGLADNPGVMFHHLQKMKIKVLIS